MGSTSWFLNLQRDGSSCSRINFFRNFCSTPGNSSPSRMTNDGLPCMLCVFTWAGKSSLSRQGRCVLLVLLFLFWNAGEGPSIFTCAWVCVLLDCLQLCKEMTAAVHPHKTTVDLVFNWFYLCFCVNMKLRVTSEEDWWFRLQTDCSFSCLRLSCKTGP